MSSDRFDIKTRDANWNHFFKSDAGKRIFAEMLKDLGYNQPIFSKDPAEMAANARCHDIIQKWINKVTYTASQVHEIAVAYQLDEMKHQQQEIREQRSRNEFTTPSVRGVS